MRAALITIAAIFLIVAIAMVVAPFDRLTEGLGSRGMGNYLRALSAIGGEWGARYVGGMVFLCLAVLFLLLGLGKKGNE